MNAHGGVGGASPIKNAKGVATVEIMPNTRTDLRGVEISGAISWPSAPPIGLAVKFGYENSHKDVKRETYKWT